MSSPLEKAIKIIIQIVKPEKIVLFGSRAKGNYKAESDYDLLVLKKGLKNQRVLTQEIYLSFKNIGSPIDVIIADLDKYEYLKTDPYLIYYEAERNGKIVYESSWKSRRMVKKS